MKSAACKLPVRAVFRRLEGRMASSFVDSADDCPTPVGFSATVNPGLENALHQVEIVGWLECYCFQLS